MAESRRIRRAGTAAWQHLLCNRRNCISGVITSLVRRSMRCSLGGGHASSLRLSGYCVKILIRGGILRQRTARCATERPGFLDVPGEVPMRAGAKLSAIDLECVDFGGCGTMAHFWVRLYRVLLTDSSILFDRNLGRAHARRCTAFRKAGLVLLKSTEHLRGHATRPSDISGLPQH